MKRLIVITSVALTLAACGPTEEERATKLAADLSTIEQMVETGGTSEANQAIALMEAEYKAETVDGGKFRSQYERALKIREDGEAADRLANSITEVVGQRRAIEEISTTQPTTMDEIRRRLSLFESAARQISSHKGAEDEALKDEVQKLRRALSSKQQAAFPAMRAGFGKAMGRELWENDVELIVQGSGNRTVRFIAGMFAANRNIAAGQDAASEVAHRLRFKRTQFEWYRGSEYTYYTLTTPSDGDVGIWSGNYFDKID